VWPSLLLLLIAGAPQLPAPPGPIIAGLRGTALAGDTLTYLISWGPGARATSYDISQSVTATNGTWKVAADSNTSGKWFPGALLPYNQGVTYTTLRTWLTAMPWDSATFTFAVASRNAIGTSASISATWTIRRVPGVPGPITVDSIAAIIVRPQGVTVGTGQSVQYCVFAVLKSGRRVKLRNSWNLPRCEQLYQQWLTEVPA